MMRFTARPFLQGVVASAAGFRPTDLSGCVLWLDAADSDSITHVANSVSQWDDKSGNNRHMTQSDGAQQPTLGTNVITFNGTTDTLRTNYIALPADSSVYIVTGPVPDNNSRRVITQGSFGGSSGQGFFLRSSNKSISLNNMKNGSQTPSNFTVRCLSYAEITADVTSTNDFEISGYNDAAGELWSGDVHELIIYSSTLSAGDDTIVRNYLLDKWFAIPLRYYPTLWLDAADPTTVTHVGGAVSQWDDKSGLGNHATQGTGANQPTYTSGEYLAFNGSAHYLSVPYDATFQGADMSIFIVCEVDGGSGTYRAPISNRDSGSKGWIIYADDTDIWEYWIGNGTAWSVIGGSGNLAATILLAGFNESSGNTQIFEENGTQKGNLNITMSPNTARDLLIGAGKNESPADFYFNGKIREVILYDSKLSAGNIAIVEAYLTAKWGVS